MSKIIKCCLAFFLVFICTVSFSFAGVCDGDQEPDRTSVRLKGGSCQEYVVGNGTAFLLAGNQDTDKFQEPKDPDQDLSRKEECPEPIQETEPEQGQKKVQKKNDPVQS